MVLMRCMKKVEEEGGKQIYVFIEKLVLETCKQIVIRHEVFRKDLINKVKDFIEKPEARTADIIPSVQVLIS
jgi:hypothetical protein